MPGVWSATGLVLDALTKVLRSKMQVSGLEGLRYGGPTLFVANHFTRFETALIPYLLYTHTRRIARSLADGELFRGGLGGFLRRVNVFPNNDPGFKQAIVRDLVSGHHDWVIFPEGAMIKTKRVRDEAGELWISNPWREGPPHTGAAVFALKAEIRRSALRGDFGVGASAWARSTLGDLEPHALPVRIVPVTFTYYPIRPGDNAIHQTVRWLVGELPPSVREELHVEGNLLLGGADIGIHFGTPLVLEPEVQSAWRRLRCRDEADDPQRIDEVVIAATRQSLTRRAMRAVYTAVEINPDHLLAAILQRSGRRPRTRHQLVLTAYLAARAIARHSRLRVHPEVLPTLEKELTIGASPMVDDFLALAERTGIVRWDADRILVDTEALAARHGFHDQRLRNPVAIMANELRGCPAAAAVVRRFAARPERRLRRDLATALLRDAEADFEHDYAAYHDPECSRPAAVGRPRLLARPEARVGVVLAHGYLSAPAEVLSLGQALHAAGFEVSLPRLPGHGTAPHNLVDVGWEDWLAAYRRALTAMQLRHEAVICAGFSTGGLLALLAATETSTEVLGAVAINTPMRLRDRRARMVPAVRRWTRWVESVGIKRPPQWIDNVSENPDVNYARNYLHGVAELMDLIGHATARLGTLRVPTLLIQGDQDPTVDPRSVYLVHRLLGATTKHVVELPRDRHIIVNGPGAAEVARIVTAFCHDRSSVLDTSPQARSA